MTEWRVVRLRRLFERPTGGTWGSDAGEADLDVACVRGTDFDTTKLRVADTRLPLRSITKAEWTARQLRRGDIVIEKSGGGEQQPVGRAVLFDLDRDAVPTNFAARLRPANGHDPPFLTYLLSSCYASGATRSAIKQTTGIQNLDLDAFLSERVLVPNEQTQRVVAKLLEAETARIDTLIVKKWRLTRIVAERFATSLEESFAAFGVRRVKTLSTKIGSGKTPSGGGESYVLDGVTFLRSQNVLMGRLDLRDVAFIDDETDEQMRTTRVRPGDVLLNITGASLGRCAVAPESLVRANVNQHVCIIRPRHGVSPALLQYAIRSKAVQDQIRQEQVGGNRDGMNFEQVGNLIVRFPSTPQEQASLGADLRRLEDRNRSTVDRLHRQIDLLREHRQALITAAVTGELDLAGAAA